VKAGLRPESGTRVQMSGNVRQNEPSRRGLGSAVRQLFRYMNQDKLLWIAPIVALLVIVVVFLVLIEGSVVQPFIYSMF
jgi:hypothetical protein